MQINHAASISCILDTDIVIDFLRQRDYARKLLQTWAGKGLLAISTLTHLEVYHGMKSREQKATDVFLDGLIPIPVDVPIARRAGRILQDLRSRGQTPGIGDAIIAATALQVSVPLLTNNIEHFPVTGLNVIRGLELR